jgi:hypothetical protein
VHSLHPFLSDYGYWALAFLIGLESMDLPLPGETVLVIASVHAANRNGNIAAVIAAPPPQAQSSATTLAMCSDANLDSASCCGSDGTSA